MLRSLPVPNQADDDSKATVSRTPVDRGRRRSGKPRYARRPFQSRRMKISDPKLIEGRFTGLLGRSTLTGVDVGPTRNDYLTAESPDATNEPYGPLRSGRLHLVPGTELNRLVFETIDHDFAAEQVRAYLEQGIELFHPMSPAPFALRVSGVVQSDDGFRILFADNNFPAKMVFGPDALAIYLLRP